MDNATKTSPAAYAATHADRRNLAIHVLTQPLFVFGLGCATIGPFVAGPGYIALGVFAMAAAIALQGRGHRFEEQRPAPFRGALDVVRRLLVEQLFLFPRFVLSGALLRALRASASPATRVLD